MTTAQQIEVLQSSIEAVQYRINELKNHVNKLQVRAWKKHKSKLQKSLDALKKIKKIEDSKTL